MRNPWMKVAAIVMATGSCFAGQSAPKNVEPKATEVVVAQEEVAENVSQDQEGEVTYQEFQEPVKEQPVRKSAAQKAREAEEAYYK